MNAQQQTRQRIQRTEAYAEKVRRMFAATVNEILALKHTHPDTDSGVMFSFDTDSRKTRQQVETLLRCLRSSVTAAIETGIKLEWGNADNDCDAFIRAAYSSKLLNSAEMQGWNARHTEAQRAFIERSDRGMNLSDRVWQSSRQLRDEMEVALTVAIGEGDDAGSISRRVRQYLNDPDLMFRRFRYKDADGNWQRKWKKRVEDPDRPGKYRFIDYDRDSYKDAWTGRGYYKSAARNAMRLARTETNIAYRRADQARWEGLDFVLGQRIHLSKEHPKEDICDDLAGDYPKDFKFDGWHPQCFCYVTPILMDADEIRRRNEAVAAGEEYTPQGTPITDYPGAFKDWVNENADRITDPGTSNPYFIQNNPEIVAKILRGESFEYNKPTALDIAEQRHAARTPEQAQAIRDAWEARQKQHAQIKADARQALVQAQDYAEVDYATLEELINKNQLSQMEAATEAVKKAVAEMQAKEAALEELMPNVHLLHKSYSLDELQEAHKELDGVMNNWLRKYNYAALDSDLTHLRNKLEFELNTPTIKYSQKAILKAALTEKIRIVDQQIAWNNLVSKAQTLLSFRTDSTEYKLQIFELETAIQSNDVTLLQRSIDAAEKMREKLLAETAPKNGGRDGALNPEYKGPAKGKNISASIDTRTMNSDDPHNKKNFTDNIARMQGYDAPAKLVSEEEFYKLEKAHGEVFYRTVNPATFNGKQMSSREFASQMFTADKLNMNGPGGRAYGGGIYVATAAWDGDTINPLTENGKKQAYEDSHAYGDTWAGKDAATISEMTFVRRPKIIKQEALVKAWDQLCKIEQSNFGFVRAKGNARPRGCYRQTDELAAITAYGCALGYDAMYCKRVNYMVIWNRSIIAVKKQ